jgi:hypothetical protein
VPWLTAFSASPSGVEPGSLKSEPIKLKKPSTCRVQS